MTGGSPKVNAAMQPEELRQTIPIAETVARSIGRSWATGPLQRAVAVLIYGSNKAQPGLNKLDGPVPD
jgi:hypothetical protein